MEMVDGLAYVNYNVGVIVPILRYFHYKEQGWKDGKKHFTASLAVPITRQNLADQAS